MNISKHITLREATHSFTAKRLGIDNNPTQEQLKNMKRVAKEVFEPLRRAIGGKPIKINSFFRSAELNKAIGGSPTSAHCKGLAIDIDDVYRYCTNAEMFDWIMENLRFDQLIWEGGDGVNPDWVHIGLSEGKPRQEVLRMYKEDRRIQYKQWAS